MKWPPSPRNCRRTAAPQSARGTPIVASRLLDTAWTAARDAGAIDNMPFPVVLKLSRVYEWQASYSSLGTEIATDVYLDMRRRGVEPVLRDGFVGFIVLTSDFVNREEDLLRRYDDALATMASLTQ